MASARLSRTPGSETNRKTWTWSAWIKRGSLTSASNGQTLWNCEGNNANDNFIFQIDGGGGTGGATDSIGLHTYGNDAFRTTPLLRDVNAWYHIVLALDTTQATATDRIKLYVNGTLQSYSQEANFPSQNYNMGINRNALHCIGSHGTNANYYFDGLMAHIHFTDGTAYPASTFGETDATTGIWKPKVSPSVTYGTNGYFLKMDNSANMGLDSSGNSNNFTTSGTIIQTKDTPSNVFATLNPLNLQPSSPPTLINGNTSVSAIADNDNVSTTLGGSFKWYYEAKVLQNPDASNGYGAAIGACHEDTFSYAGWAAGTRSGFENSAVKWYGNTISNAGRFLQGAGNQIIAGLTQATAGDIVGCACDSANGRVYIHINGVYQNSGDPVNGTGFIGGVTAKTGLWFPWINSEHTYGTVDVNFGNGYFGTTAVTSAQNPDDGNGIFEYDVPAGYRALCTKSINAPEYS